MTHTHTLQPHRIFLYIGACLALLVPASPSGQAAPAPPAGVDALEQDGSHRARLYAGDCETIALTDAISTDTATRQSGSDETWWSSSFAMTMDGPLGDVTAEPHAISIDVVEGDLATSLACAEQTGEIVGDRLIVPITTTESGEVVGIAVLAEDDDGQVAVVVYLILAADGTPPRPTDRTEPDIDDADDTDDSIDDSPEGGV